MTWLTEILRICPDEQLLIQYCVIKAFDIVENLNYDGYERGLASMVYKIFYDKSFSANTSGDSVKMGIISNQELAEELHKPIIRKHEVVCK